MSLEATVAQLAEEEVDDAEFDITIDLTLLQEDFCHDQEDESCLSGEGEGLDDDPSCDYVEDLCNKSNLKVLRESQARVAYAQNSSLGLFHLFLTKTWFSAMRQWTNQRLSANGKKKISQEQFMAYIELEIAMSFVKLNQVRDYWTDKIFFQQKDFQSVMPRNLFQDICGSVMLHDPDLYNHNIASADPLHLSRNLLSHFL
jgi:hypothetical protein